MPSTPTTKSQVQAYRFVLRRMESALVRKDPVMLHDPMRSHKRATIVGAIIGVVGLVVFVLIGVLNPAPPVPPTGIVIAQPSGTMYVVSENPHELIPVFNLASARLLLAATAANQQGAGGAASNSAPAVVTPVIVSDGQLASMPMGRMTGIQDGPTVLPNPGQKPVDWAVCDQVPRDTNALNQTGHNPPGTTVLVGEPNIGTNLAVDEALLVSNDGGKTLYLVYGHSSTVNDPDDSAVKAKIDNTDQGVLGGLEITDPTQYRVVSTAVLNAIPTVGEIKNPADGLDTTAPVAPALAGTGLTIGQSFSVQAVGQPSQYYMVVPGGKQAVSQTTAQIARHENSAGSNDIPQVTPEAADTVKPVSNGLTVDTSEYPGVVPTVISADTKPVMCLGWHADYTDAQKPLSKTRVTVDTNLELPPDSHSPTGQMQTVQIGQGTSAGKVNSFFMNPAIGGVAIRSASGAKEFGNGPIYVIDPRGLAFSVPNLLTAQVLGVADATGLIPPAPASIVGLLPLGGQSLDTQAVQRTFDSMQVPDNAGQYLTPTQAPGN
ncbi:MAG TPA: type VII secretion protein EccB [Pseudonocardiaceae bacterium]|jgi:type VII secretion protein EccB|nr:type VII secretion protein EccB [Pseudonocardiaceae bacterium]